MICTATQLKVLKNTSIALVQLTTHIPTYIIKIYITIHLLLNTLKNITFEK